MNSESRTLVHLRNGHMPDNLSRRGPEDPLEIHINQKHERDYWTEALGISELKLKLTVIQVGPLVADVKAWLRKNK
jgi:Protein of unknown function (DUF3606)